MNGALAGLVILAMGDSHMVYMGPPLHEALEQQGATVNTYGMCGAMPTDWLSPGTRNARSSGTVKGRPRLNTPPRRAGS